jgi:phosphate/sulfate permease
VSIVLFAAVIHGIVAWLDAYGIGANDVANAFGTSVGESMVAQYIRLSLTSLTLCICVLPGVRL